MNNKFPQLHLIYNRYKKASATQKAVIELRITYDYKQKYISTGIWLYPNQWKKGKIINCPDVVQISQTLDKLLIDVRQVIYEMMSEGTIDIFSIPERIKKKRQGSISFIQYCNQRAEIRKYGKKKDSQKRYDRFIRRLTAWGKIKEFDDINDKNIINYDKYLDSMGMRPYSKWNNYHRFLNSFILDAIDDGHLKRNPYKWLNIDKQKNSLGIDKCLTPDEFRRLKNATMITASLERVKDLFVFQTYTCLSYSDLRAFDEDNIHTINGSKVYIMYRKKTNKKGTIPLLPPALKILRKYMGRLPIISNVKYNEYLKAVAMAAGIDKPISSHWARHTGATLLLNEGVDLKVVSKICGHSSTRITEQVYAKLLDKTVIDAVQDVHI